MHYNKKVFFIIPDFSDWLSGLQDYLYIINLEQNKFEIYNMNLSMEEKDINSEFENYKILKKFGLDNIPKDWEMNI